MHTCTYVYRTQCECRPNRFHTTIIIKTDTYALIHTHQYAPIGFGLTDTTRERKRRFPLSLAPDVHLLYFERNDLVFKKPYTVPLGLLELYWPSQTLSLGSGISYSNNAKNLVSLGTDSFKQFWHVLVFVCFEHLDCDKYARFKRWKTLINIILSLNVTRTYWI